MAKEAAVMYGRLLGYTRPYAKTFGFGILAMILLGVTEAGIPALLKPVLDGTFVDKNPTWLVLAPLAIIGLFFVRGAANLGSTLAFTTVGTKVIHDLRQAMFSRLLNLPTHAFDQSSTSGMVSRLLYDVNQVMEASTQVLTVLVKDSISIIALVAYVFWLDWKLSLVIFLLAPVVATSSVFLGRRMRIISRRLQKNFADLMHVLEESARGHKVVKIYGGQDYETKRFGQTSNTTRQQMFKLQTAAALNVPVVEFIGACLMALIIYLGTSMTKGQQMSVGEFVSFFTALGLLFSPIKRLTRINEPLQRGLAGAESIFGLLDEAPESDTGTHTQAQVEGRLQFQQVEMRYEQTERNALGPIDLTIEPRTTVALVGASGSGKSTLVNLIPRLYEPTAGRILLDGVDLRDWQLTNLRQHIAFVSQEVLLFNDTVAANIAYGSPIDLQAVRAAAEAAYALEFIDTLPQGLDTLVGENGIRLSGGQRQRLAIARALYADAPVLIFDEATSALDSHSERAVQLGLERLRQGRTTLIIAHRLSTIQHADTILVMQDGAIVERGNHTDLLAANGYYRRLYDTQFRSPSAAAE